MKTLRILFALCIMLGFTTNYANSQRTTGTQEWHISYSPETVPCLTEIISGTVTEYQSFTRITYHVLGRGILYGESTGDPYEISYEYNSCGQAFGNSFHHPNGSQYYIGPVLLKHDGKLFAELHFVGQFVNNGQGVYVQDRFIIKVNCK